jgi:hypothetical protein
MDIKGFFKSVWKHFTAWFILLSDLIFVINMIRYYDDPLYGFNIFGPIVFISALFPLIWVLLYILGDRKGNTFKSTTAAVTSKPEQEETK